MFRLSDIQKDAFVHADVDGIDPNAVGIVKDLKDGKLLVHIDTGLSEHAFRLVRKPGILLNFGSVGS